MEKVKSQKAQNIIKWLSFFAKSRVTVSLKREKLKSHTVALTNIEYILSYKISRNCPFKNTPDLSAGGPED
jgi:hypothetical protein